MQSKQLPTKSQVFEDEVLARTASAEHPTEEMSERHDHSKNLIGTIRIQLFAKSFILQVYDVLARLMGIDKLKKKNGTRRSFPLSVKRLSAYFLKLLPLRCGLERLWA